MKRQSLVVRRLAGFLNNLELPSYHLPHNLLNGPLVLFDVVPQSLIDLCLISPAFTLSFILKPFQYIRINEDRDPGLTLRPLDFWPG